jgi:hypothetical protein
MALPEASAHAAGAVAHGPPGPPDLRWSPHLLLAVEPGTDATSGEPEDAPALVPAQGLRRAAAYRPLRAWAGRGQLHLAIRLTDRLALMPTYRVPSLGSGPENERAHRFMVIARWRF